MCFSIKREIPFYAKASWYQSSLRLFRAVMYSVYFRTYFCRPLSDSRYVVILDQGYFLFCASVLRAYINWHPKDERTISYYANFNSNQSQQQLQQQQKLEIIKRVHGFPK